MRFSEFKRHILDQPSGKLLIDLDDLEIYHPDNNKVIKLVRDKRSYLDRGRWHIYPIAVTDTQAYIVCPYCGEIHLHGNEKGDYSGDREAHCKVPLYKRGHCYIIEQAD